MLRNRTHHAGTVDPFAGKTDSEIATFWDRFRPNVRTLDQPLSDAHRKRKA